ncbi:MAG: type II toxin-antitoxin system VapC family toxin [Desulfamplus sp.]|nr:type II toxin-antitoxin system VapC family toxin [Desulfamplus sp.]
MILCDTDILIEFYKNNVVIINELKHIGQVNLSVSAITQAELYFGAFDKRELKKIHQHLATIFRFPLDTTISECFLLLMQTYSLSHKLGLPDALIAATALVHQLSLYTLNIKHFQFIPQLKLYRPVTY